jgi:hypothetical protein
VKDLARNRFDYNYEDTMFKRLGITPESHKQSVEEQKREERVKERVTPTAIPKKNRGCYSTIFRSTINTY